MSRRSRLAIKYEKGGKSIYLHDSDKPSVMLEFLKEFYFERDKVEKIMELGDCSRLKEKLEPTTSTHSFNTPEDNVSIFYGRDRGEKKIKAKKFKDKDDLISQGQDSWAETIYVYNNEIGRWDILID